MSKADAIRAALRAGVESPTAASNYIREQFGIDVSKTHFSAFKSLAKRAEKVDACDACGAVEACPGPPRIEAISDGDLIAALEVMKPLVASLGADKVKRIVDLLG